MKKAELSAFLKQIQPEQPGFKVKGQVLFIDPIDHTLRGVWLDHSMEPLLCARGSAFLVTCLRTLFHQETALLSVRKIPFPEVSPVWLLN